MRFSKSAAAVAERDESINYVTVTEEPPAAAAHLVENFKILKILLGRDKSQEPASKKTFAYQLFVCVCV